MLPCPISSSPFWLMCCRWNITSKHILTVKVLSCCCQSDFLVNESSLFYIILNLLNLSTWAMQLDLFGSEKPLRVVLPTNEAVVMWKRGIETKRICWNRFANLFWWIFFIVAWKSYSSPLNYVSMWNWVTSSCSLHTDKDRSDTHLTVWECVVLCFSLLFISHIPAGY